MTPVANRVTRRQLEPEEASTEEDRDYKDQRAYVNGVRRPVEITLGDAPSIFKRPYG